MNLLLDTHLLLWCAGEPQKLSQEAVQLLNNPEHTLIFSAASFWEITIKRSLGREDFRVEPRLLRRGLHDNGWRELPITTEHTVAVEHLPSIHKDPFDRILVAQADVEGFLLLTHDDMVAQYPGPIKKV